jgi:hypothetical protein
VKALKLTDVQVFTNAVAVSGRVELETCFWIENGTDGDVQLPVPLHPRDLFTM